MAASHTPWKVGIHPKPWAGYSVAPIPSGQATGASGSNPGWAASLGLPVGLPPRTMSVFSQVPGPKTGHLRKGLMETVPFLTFSWDDL